MSRMIFLVVMIAYCLPTSEAARLCQDPGVNGARSQFFHQAPNQTLAGHQYRNITGARSTFQCCAACLTDTGCFSVQYSDRGELCQLNGASASRFPLALTTATDGTSYYGPEKPSFIALLQQHFTAQDPSPTDCLHQTFTSASSECKNSSQHLCYRWELQHALLSPDYGAGMSSDTAYWYATLDSQVQYTQSEDQLVYRDLGPIILAKSDYPSTGSAGTNDTADFCSSNSSGRHLCTLKELKQAFLKGYRQPSPDQWVAFSESSRSAQLFADDGCGDHTGSECYEGVVANIPSTNTSDMVYCCLDGVEVVAPGICCTGVIPFFTEGVYLLADRDGMIGDCSNNDAHLCTLAELKEAYQNGYRQPSSVWLFFALPDRDVQLFSDGCGTYIDAECYEGVVANTPRPTADKHRRAFCCIQS